MRRNDDKDEPNFQRVRASQKPLVAGDIFRMKLRDETYLLGRVVLTEPPRQQAPGPKCNLVYVYRDGSVDGEFDVANLRPERLLIAPIYINRLGWSRGYFETVGNRPLAPEDLLAQHCFLRYNGNYLDERGRPLPGRVQPCGAWGIGNYRIVDDLVSEALGIPLAPVA